MAKEHKKHIPNNPEIEQLALKYLVRLDEIMEVVESFKTLKDDFSAAKIVPKDEETQENSKDSSSNEIDTRTKTEKALDDAYDKSAEIINKTQDIILASQKGLHIIMTRITNVAKLIKSLTDISKEINEIMNFITGLSQELLNTPIINYLKLTCQLVLLDCKKELIKLNKITAEQSIKLLNKFINGKVSNALMSMYAAPLTTLIKLGEAVQTAVAYIDKTLGYLPKNLLVDADAMSFFMTPKMATGGTKVPIYNINASMANYISTALDEALKNLNNTPKIANTASKASFISARVAEAQANLEVGNSKIPVPEINVQQAMNLLYQAEDKLISLLPSPMPLPKYENLNMLTNIGFDMWLITGWCRAGQVAFGLPGQIPGVPA